MILGYYKRFVAPIMEGTKIHTLREDPHRKWEAGIKIHMTAVDLYEQYCFNDKEHCTGVQEVKMNINWFNDKEIDIIIDGKELNLYERHFLAKRDGFIGLDGYEDFKKWFLPLIEKNGGRLQLRLIHWTDFRY